MNALAMAASDSTTMLRRNLKRARRYPGLTAYQIAIPVVFLVLFVGVLGGVMGDGLGGAAVGASYVDFMTPGILALTVATCCMMTATAVAIDMDEGIINRFRTMAITRSSVLTGHVIGTFIQTMISLALVVGAALLLGFRPTAGLGEWLAAVGLLALATVVLTWLGVAFGVAAKNPEVASNSPTIFVLLPFFGSGFVPTETMPTVVRWFAEYQPFTPIIDTLRGLLMGSPIGNSGVIAVAWCVGLTVVGFFWSRALYNRDPTPR